MERRETEPKMKHTDRQQKRQTDRDTKWFSFLPEMNKRELGCSNLPARAAIHLEGSAPTVPLANAAINESTDHTLLTRR